MNLLTNLVFILCLGYLYCSNDIFVPTSPEIREQCRKQENVGEKNITDLEEKNIVNYYNCVFEKQGIIVNGRYVGNNSNCKGVADDNKFQLALKVVLCSASEL